MNEPKDANSLSRQDVPSQPDDENRGSSPDSQPRVSQSSDSQSSDSQSSDELRIETGPRPTAHVVLYQPEIPQNTGNIGRTCVAVNAKLWIVRPASFQLDDGRLKRAGLDYWQHLKFGEARNWEHLVEQLEPRRFFFLSRFAKRPLWDVDLAEDDVFVFGRETSGLPETILDPDDPRSVRLPTTDQVRSLNLATTVGAVMYEHRRQLAMAARKLGE